jgi:hypothetical protein
MIDQCRTEISLPREITAQIADLLNASLIVLTLLDEQIPRCLFAGFARPTYKGGETNQRKKLPLGF